MDEQPATVAERGLLGCRTRSGSWLCAAPKSSVVAGAASFGQEVVSARPTPALRRVGADSLEPVDVLPQLVGAHERPAVVDHGRQRSLGDPTTDRPRSPVSNAPSGNP